MKKIQAFIEITRPVNLLITFAVVYISAIICSDNFLFTINIVLAGLSAAFVAASGNIINDYFDFEIDKINRPNRPIPSGVITRKEAVLYYLILSFVAILISYLVSFQAVSVVVLTLILLYFYSYLLKSIPLVGNVLVAFCTAFAFIYGGIVVGNINAAFIPAVFAFLINLIREIIKDIEDLDGDKENNVITFPSKYGLEKTKIILLVLTFILILTTFYPFASQLYKVEYFILVLFIVDLPLVYFALEIYSKHYLTKLSKLSLSLKIIMIFGLISIYVGRI